MALKFVNKSKTKLKNFLREVSITNSLSSSPFIIKVFDVVFETEDCYVFAQEYAPAGDLFDIIPPQVLGVVAQGWERACPPPGAGGRRSQALPGQWQGDRMKSSTYLGTAGTQEGSRDSGATSGFPEEAPRSGGRVPEDCAFGGGRGESVPEPRGASGKACQSLDPIREAASGGAVAADRAW